jgi:hypothetical protein
MSAETFKTLDSGERQQFETGAQRDTETGKGRPALQSPFAMRRRAALLERGAVKYDARNWEKGMPFSRVLDSTFRHLIDYMAGDREEDHLAAITFNTDALMHYEEMIKRGVLPVELNDLPDYHRSVHGTRQGGEEGDL